MNSEIATQWSKRDIRGVVQEQMSARDELVQSEKVRCLLTILQNYSFGLLHDFRAAKDDMESQIWHDGLGDIQNWNTEHVQREVNELMREYPEINQLYAHTTAKFVQLINKGSTVTHIDTVLKPLSEFIHRFIAILLKRPDVRSRAALAYNLHDKKSIAIDTLRLTLMQMYGSTVHKITPDDSVSQIKCNATVSNDIPESKVATFLATKLNGLHSIKTNKDNSSRTKSNVSKFRREPKSLCFWDEGSKPDFPSRSVAASVRE